MKHGNRLFNDYVKSHMEGYMHRLVANMHDKNISNAKYLITEQM